MQLVWLMCAIMCLQKSSSSFSYFCIYQKKKKKSLMASIRLFEAFITFFCFLTFCYLFRKKTFSCLLIRKIPKIDLWNWPVLGMLPGVLVILHRIYDWSVELLENSNLTIPIQGPMVRWNGYIGHG